jgi:hypothetical protein
MIRSVEQFVSHCEGRVNEQPRQHIHRELFAGE